MPQGSRRCESRHLVSNLFARYAPGSAYPQTVIWIELHLLIEDCCDFSEVVFYLLVGVWMRCAAQHRVAHNGGVYSIEEAEEDGTRHFVLCCVVVVVVGEREKLGTGGGGLVSRMHR